MTLSNSAEPGCFGAILSKLASLLGRQSKTPEALPYKLTDKFLTPAELSYYKVLTSVLSPKAVVNAKVNLADILFVSRPNENISFRNRIAQKHVDFLLCDATSMKPALVIELDDASHKRADRRKRDKFVDKALHAAGMPILHVTQQRQYSREEVISQLKPFLTSPTPEIDNKAEEAESTTPMKIGPPNCPKCGAPMVLRTASRGEHKGRQFFGCQNYPNCRQVLPVPAT